MCKIVQRLLNNETVSEQPIKEKRFHDTNYRNYNLIYSLVKKDQQHYIPQIINRINFLLSLNNGSKPYYDIWLGIVKNGNPVSIDYVVEKKDNEMAQIMRSLGVFTGLRDKKNRMIENNYLDVLVASCGNEELFDFLYRMKNRLRFAWSNYDLLMYFYDNLKDEMDWDNVRQFLNDYKKNHT